MPSSTTLLAAGWLTLIAVAFFWATHRQPKLQLGILLAIAASVRIVPALLSADEATYDFDSYRAVARALLDGQDVYSHALDGRYPYPPGWDIYLAATYQLTYANDYEFGLLVRLPSIIADVAIVGLVARCTSPSLGLIQALNPLSVTISGYHGQFDSLPLLAGLVSLVLANPVAAGAALGVGIWIKLWPAMLLLPLFCRFGCRRGSLACLAALVVALSTSIAAGAVTHADPQLAIARIAAYRSGHDWGIPALLAWFGLLPAWWIPVAGAVVVATYLLVRSARDEWGATCATLLTVLALSPGVAAQYLTWIGPFAVWAGTTRWLSRLVLVSLPYYAIGFFGVLPNDAAGKLWTLPTFYWYFMSIPGWTVVVCWLAWTLRQTWLPTGVDRKGEHAYVRVGEHKS